LVGNILSTDRNDLLARINARSAVVGIIGMGYVGLPLMLAAVKAGFRVTGFDIDLPKVEQLNRGQSPLKHISNDAILAVCRNKLFDATADFARLKGADVIVLCVPTPLSEHREPDLSFVVNTAKIVALTLRGGQLILLESTTYPGTTDEVVRPILEETGLKSGSDFFLAFSPEREDPGNQHFSTSQIPRVVGADDERALALVQAFYAAIVKTVVLTSSTKTAEAVKITENVFRAVNIALVNELKAIFSRMQIDIFEVINAAKTKPFGYMPFYPGPGLGGHCIPIDPFYLTWKAREYGFTTRFIELAGEINSNMPRYVVDRLADALDQQHGIALSRARVLVIGVSYKKDVDDMRESPALAVLNILQRRQVKVDYHDPLVPRIPPTRQHPELGGMESVPLDRATVASYDAVLIVTDHSAIDWQALVDAARLVVDTRNATAGTVRPSGRVVPA
jgi:UDP-N-acetyl-D-glucosamine dehydrogenase